MFDLLQPQDDGLSVRETGAWAAEKLDYVARYVNVFETSMRNKWPVRNYIDLLCGPGKNRIRETGRILLGSPLLALTTKYPFTGYYFVDNSEENTKALRQRCSELSEHHQVNILTGDCNQLINKIVTLIKRDELHSLNLAFLDPQGLELHWDTVAQLASIRRMDLIINYPQGGLNRYMRQASEKGGQTAVDRFFGGSEWRKIYERWQKKQIRVGVHRPLIDHYKQKLRNLGYKEIRENDELGDEPLIRNVKRKAPLYRLLFASKHPLGHDFWQKVTRRNVYGQGRLF